MQKLLNFILTLDNLSRIPRTGGVLFAGIDPNRTDSLAEHSFKTAYLCLLLGKLSVKHHLHIDFAHLLAAAISHNWADCILLDIPTSSPSYKSYFKDIDLREIYFKAEKQARLEMEEFLMPELEISVSDHGLTAIENKLLTIADITALLTEVLEFKFEGMRLDWIDFMWSNTLKRLESFLVDDFQFLQPLAADLQQTFITGSKPANPFLTKPQHQTLKKDTP